MDGVCVVLWNKEEEERELTIVCGFRCEIVCVFVLSVCAVSAMRNVKTSLDSSECAKKLFIFC